MSDRLEQADRRGLTEMLSDEDEQNSDERRNGRILFSSSFNRLGSDETRATDDCDSDHAYSECCPLCSIQFAMKEDDREHSNP